jgi:hypothetical protein
VNRPILASIAVSILFLGTTLTLGLVRGSETGTTSAAVVQQQTSTPTTTATATPTASPTPSATPTPSAQPCPLPCTEVTFVNNTGQAASDLHIEFEGTSTSSAQLLQNASGCPSPAVFLQSPHDFEVAVDWGNDCVDPGESVKFLFGADNPMGPKPEVSCFYWTRFGAFIEGQSPPCAETFVNNTGQAAGDLHIEFVPGPAPVVSVGLIQNAPGCPQPTYLIQFNVDVDWGVGCVDPGESVRLLFIPQSSTLAPPRVSSFTWSFGTPTATPTPAPTLPPGLHDGRAKKISAASSVVLSDGTPDVKNVVVQVRNEGDHTETFAVYVDIVPPGGVSNPYGCTPVGRIIDEVVTLAPDEQTAVQASPTFDCADVSGALDQTYTIMAAVDVHADDGGPCAEFQIQSMACFTALADDDNDPSDNRATTNALRVK